jgi:uncharacterized protein YegL
LDTGNSVLGGTSGASALGTIRAAPDLSVVVAGNALEQYGRGCGNRHSEYGPYYSIYVLECADGDWSQCKPFDTVIGTEFYVGIEVMADADTLLVATAERTAVCELIAPFRVQKYSLREIAPMPEIPGRWATHRLGQSRGAIDTSDPVVVILKDPDGHRAHLLTQGSDDPGRVTVHTIDVVTMAEVAPPIQLPPLTWIGSPWRLPRAALSPDGAFLVTTRLARPDINVVDLYERRAWSVPIEGATAVADVSFSHGPGNHGLLALYVHRSSDPMVATEVIIAELGPSSITERGRGPTSTGNYGYAPMAVEWTAEGLRLIASVDSWVGPPGGPASGPAAAVFSVQDGGRRVTKVRDLYPCAEIAFVVDIFTANGNALTPTPVPTEAATGTSTATNTLPPPTATASPMPSATPTATAIPVPLYLPLTLREHCSPEYQRADIALVIDTSSSMTGQKIVDAREAALLFVSKIDLAPNRSQVAVVRYDREAEVVSELTKARAVIEAAIRSLHVRSGTHIDKGLRAALAELRSPRRVGWNLPVVVLLTDGVQTGTPGEELKAAAEVRDAGVRLYTIGLGADVDEDTLRAIAGADERYYYSPDSADLARIYSEIAMDLMCAGKWGGR